MKRQFGLMLLAASLSLNTLAQSISGLQVIYVEKNIIDSAKYEKLPSEIKMEAYAVLSKVVEATLLHEGNISTYTTNFLNTTNTTVKKSVDMEQTRIKKVETASSFWYKDFDKNIYYSKATLLGENYLIIDSLNSNWIIQDEFQMIDSFRCQKAILKRNGALVVGWFTESIPVNDGPQIYGGLPGLLLRIELPRKVFYATKISYLKSPIDFPSIPSGGKQVTAIQFKTAESSQFNAKNDKTTTETIGKETRTHTQITY